MDTKLRNRLQDMSLVYNYPTNSWIYAHNISVDKKQFPKSGII
jgi:hypothetical protein